MRYWYKRRAPDMFQVLLVISSITSWGLRWWFDAHGAAKDALFLTVFILTGHGLAVRDMVSAVVEKYPPTITAGVGSAILIHIISNRWKYLYRRKARVVPPNGDSEGHLKTSMRPLLFPCRTKHTRLFPKKHSFSYSYLFVGIPVGWKGCIGSLLSADLQSLGGKDINSEGYSKWGKSWFSVDAADYLSRGEAHLGLEGKLHAYLRTQVSLSAALTMAQAYGGTGFQSRRISVCILDHCSSFLRLFIQSCFFLVPILGEQGIKGDDPRSQ